MPSRHPVGCGTRSRKHALPLTALHEASNCSERLTNTLGMNSHSSMVEGYVLRAPSSNAGESHEVSAAVCGTFMAHIDACVAGVAVYGAGVQLISRRSPDRVHLPKQQSGCAG